MIQRIDTYRDGVLVSSTQVEIAVSAEEQNAATLRDRAATSLAGLALIKRSTGTLTLLQLSNAVRLLATVVLAIARLQLSRLDDTDE